MLQNKRIRASSLLCWTAALTFLLFSFCAGAPTAKGQLLGYKGKRAMAQYVADLNVGWVMSDFGVPEDNGLNLWTHELNFSYLVSRSIALEASFSYARHSVSVATSSAFSDFFDFPGYERYNQTTYAFGMRIGDIIQPIGFYFTPSIYYGRAVSRYPVLQEFMDSEFGGFPLLGEPEDAEVDGIGFRLEWGIHRALNDYLLLRVATRFGLGLALGEDTSYKEDDYYGVSFFNAIYDRYLLNEVFSLRVGIGYMF